MKEFLKSWLTYSRAERNGIIILSLILFLAIVWRLLLPVLIKPVPIAFDPAAFQKEIIAFQKDTLLDLNTATVQQLRYLKGIGPALSQRIVDYRNDLGGYTEIEQVSEIKGIGEAKYAAISPHLKVDSNHLDLRKIAVNSAPKEQLEAHPYINPDLAAAIIRRRPFKNLEEMKRIMNEEQFSKLKQYMEVK